MATIRLSVAEAAERFRQMRVDVPKALKAVARAVCIDVQTEALRNLNGTYLDSRTGTLMWYASANMRPIKVSDGWAIGLPKGDLEARIGRVHETGAVIKAKNWFTKSGAGPFLVFPDPSGPGLTATGQRSNAKGAQVKLIFAKQVTIPSRPWFSAGVNTALLNVPKHVNELVAKAIAGQGVPE
jgi:hypothetical protein